MKIDGTDDVKINNVDSNWVTVYKGWIYYAAVDEIMPGGSFRYNLYRIRTDGTDFQKLTNTSILKPNVSDDGFIYYISGDSGDFGIYKIRYDGTQNTKINSDFIMDINVVGDSIYYIDPGTSSLAKMNTNGMNKIILDDERIVFSMVADKNWVYYCAIERDDFTFTPYLRKISSDGNTKVNLNVTDCDRPHVIGNMIYYTMNENALYKITTNGTENGIIN